MSIETSEQADEIVYQADLAKGNDYSEAGLRRQADYIREHLGPDAGPDEKQLVLEALTKRCSQRDDTSVLESTGDTT